MTAGAHPFDSGGYSQFAPGSTNEGPRARAHCASGHATGSYGISMQERSHSIPEARDKPGGREKSPLQKANLGGVPSPLNPSSKESGKSKADYFDRSEAEPSGENKIWYMDPGAQDH